MGVLENDTLNERSRNTTITPEYITNDTETLWCMMEADVMILHFNL